MRVFIGISPSGKASDSESDIRRFESYYPSHFCIKFLTFCGDLFFVKIFAKKVEKQKFFRIIPLSNYYFYYVRSTNHTTTTPFYRGFTKNSEKHFFRTQNRTCWKMKRKNRPHNTLSRGGNFCSPRNCP